MVAVLLALLSLACGAFSADLEGLVASDNTDTVRVWWDRGGLANDDFIVWAPKPTDGTNYKILGHRGQMNHNDIEDSIMSFKDVSADGDALIEADAAQLIWDDRRSVNLNDGSTWRLICPQNYVAVGDFFYGANRIEKPGQDFSHKNRCVRKDLTKICSIGNGNKIWDDSGSLALTDVSVWYPTVDSTEVGGFLFSNNIHEKPPSIEAHCLLTSSYTVA